jgi:hypothetical protein
MTMTKSCHSRDVTFSTNNIALNKPAWEHSQFNPGDDRCHASNAVDGRRSDLSDVGGQCAISSKRQQAATWMVDLEDTLSMRHITMYYRTDIIIPHINNH